MNIRSNQLALAATLLGAPTRNDTNMEFRSPREPRPFMLQTGQAVSAKRQAKKATGLVGRQWVKYHKAIRRGRPALSRAERRASERPGDPR